MTEVAAKRMPYKPGTKMADGTIYACMSPTRNQPMYVAPVDASLKLNFNAAASYAKKLQVGDKNDFRVPDREELRVIFENKDEGALRGTFDVTGDFPAGYYWSSSTSTGSPVARDIRCKDGYEEVDYKSQKYSLRCVR